MGQNFLGCGREQAFLLPPDVRDWLPEGHFAWFVLDAVARMELTAFYAAYRRDGHGRAAFEPAMMVALLLYAYARGIRSSRAIERACEEDVAFRVIAADRFQITRRSRASVSATRTRWPSCSARSWPCARRPAWCGRA
jgi:transposase